MLLIMSVYGVHFFRDDLRYMTNSLIVQKAGETVQAWYIAQIVHFDGSFIIEHGGKKLQTSVIRDGDIVTLKDKTEMVFHIDDQTKAKLVGPAQFVLNTKGGEEQSYTLQLLQGNFVEIESLTEETTQAISIVSDDVIVQQEKWSIASHFQLSQEGDNKRIENKGAEIKVTRTQENSPIETKVAAKQTLALAANDITLIDDETQIARVLIQKDLSQTVAIADVEDKVVSDNEIDIAILSSVFKAQEDIKVSEKVISAVDTMISSSKQEKTVVTPEQNNQLRGNLDGGILTQNMQSILITHIEGNNEELVRNIVTLQDKIITIYKVFWLTAPKGSSTISHTIELATQLYKSLDKQYYMPPRYMQNIETIGSWLEYIAAQPAESQEDGKAYREKSSSSIPSNLRFQ